MMFNRMTGLAAAGVLLAGLAGCQSNELQTRKEVTAAALSQYPGSARASDTFKLSAVDSPSAGTVELFNVTDNAVPANSKVWVNGRFVKLLPAAIPARGTVSIMYGDFLESSGGINDLARTKQAVAKVEIQTDQGLFVVDGPARK